MYINPVLFGVLATLGIESVIVNILLVMAWIERNKPIKKTNTTTIKGGKYNG